MLHMYDSDVLRGLMLMCGIGIERLGKISGYSENQIRMMTLGLMKIDDNLWGLLDADYRVVEFVSDSVMLRGQEDISEEDSRV